MHSAPVGFESERYFATPSICGIASPHQTTATAATSATTAAATTATTTTTIAAAAAMRRGFYAAFPCSASSKLVHFV